MSRILFLTLKNHLFYFPILKESKERSGDSLYLILSFWFPKFEVRGENGMNRKRKKMLHL